MEILDLNFLYSTCFKNGSLSLNDLSGNGNNFTLTSTDYSYDASIGGLTLNPGNEANATPTNFNFGSAALSFVLWIKFNTTTDANSRIMFGLQNTGVGFDVLFDGRFNGNAIKFLPGINSSSIKYWNFTFDNQWHLFTITRPNASTTNDVQIYIDGVENTDILNIQLPNTLLQTVNQSYATINQNPGSTTAPFIFASFQIYDYQLTQSDISTIYTNEVGRFINPLPVISGQSNGRRFGQGFPQ